MCVDDGGHKEVDDYVELKNRYSSMSGVDEKSTYSSAGEATVLLCNGLIRVGSCYVEG